MATLAISEIPSKLAPANNARPVCLGVCARSPARLLCLRARPRSTPASLSHLGRQPTAPVLLLLASASHTLKPSLPVLLPSLFTLQASKAINYFSKPFKRLSHTHSHPHPQPTLLSHHEVLNCSRCRLCCLSNGSSCSLQLRCKSSHLFLTDIEKTSGELPF